MVSDGEADRILQAKYLDWCSARLADRVLHLTPDEIYQLAQQASAETELEPGGSSAVGTELSHRALLGRVTEALLARDPLPSFEEWAAAYAESPEQFDEELAGFWNEQS